MTDEEYRDLLRQAAEAYCRVHKWVRPEDAAKWYDMVVSLDETREHVTGRGILFQNVPPEGFNSFMTAWMRARTIPGKWIATRFGDGPPVDPERDGVFVDEGFSVGRVRYDPPTDRDGPHWWWAFQAASLYSPIRPKSGRAPTKAEAKRLVENLYAAFCSHAGARDDLFAQRQASRQAGEVWATRQGLKTS